MADFEVKGAEHFLELSKALKRAGQTAMRKELHAGMRRAAKPLIAKTRAEARRRLPKGGGLADQVAKEPQRVQVRTGARSAGVRLAVSNKAGGARAANRGKIRHPVFGNRDVWVDQKVPAGWFDDPAEAEAPQIRRELDRAVRDIVAQIERGL